MKKTLAYIITGSAPDSLFAELQQIPALDSAALMGALLRAEKKGWVKILGVVKGSPEDVAAILREHAKENPKGERSRRKRDGSKKRME